MKKPHLRSLLAVAALCVVVGALVRNAPHPMILENETTEVFGEDGMTFIADAEVPLAELPEAPEAAAPADSYEGLDSTQIAYVEEVLAMVNAEREKAGLPPLELDVSLRQAAQTRAAECVGKFSHTRPNGTSYKTAITEAGIEVGYSGENVATGYTSAEHVMQGWMNSAGHKANILNKNFTKIGIGLVENAGSYYGGYAWSQLFVA